jgi:8-oxo-dGTP pyrophosphatase MutT (NUDIX family)
MTNPTVCIYSTTEEFGHEIKYSFAERAFFLFQRAIPMLGQFAIETLREAIVREVSEEIGLTLEAHNIDVALVMHRYSATSSPPERLDFFTRVDKWHAVPINLEPDKCSNLRWFHLRELPENVIPYIKHALNEVTAGRKYCEYGWADRYGTAGGSL